MVTVEATRSAKVVVPWHLTVPHKASGIETNCICFVLSSLCRLVL